MLLSAIGIVFGKVPNLGLIFTIEVSLVSLKIEEVLCGGLFDALLDFVGFHYREVHMVSSLSWSRSEIVGKFFGFVENIPAVTIDTIIGKFKCPLIFRALSYRYPFSKPQLIVCSGLSL